MSDDEKLSAERAVRLLRAKAAQMETWVKPRLGGPGTTDLDWLVADVALIADLLADHIEMTRAPCPYVRTSDEGTAYCSLGTA